MRASRGKKRAVDARRTQKRRGAGRARKAGVETVKRPAKVGAAASGVSRSTGKSNHSGKARAAKPKTATTAAASAALPKRKAASAAKRPELRAGANEALASTRSPVRAAAVAGSSASLTTAEVRGAAAAQVTTLSPVVPVQERGTPPPLPAPIASFVF
jgi:hypothetical protein